MIHILDKQTDTILTFLRTNVSEAIHEEDLRYTETFDFSVWMDEKAQYVSERNRAIIQADDGSYREFIIRKTQEDRNLVTAFSDASFLDLDRQRIISPVTLYGQTIESAANYILNGTEWQLGIAEHFGSQKIVFDSHIGAFQALKHIASNFNCEMRFRVEIKGNKVSGRYVDFFKRRGQFRGKEVTFGKDLMDIRRIEESADIVTALLCIGPEQQDGTRLTATVVDNDALQRFGRNGKHLWGIYEADTNEQNLSIERLTELGQTELKKRIQSVVQYETTQAALERIHGLEHERVYLADTIRVKDTKFHPPLYLEARAIRVKRNLLDPSQKEYTLGEFIEYKEEDVRKRFIELQRLYGLRVIKSPAEPEGTLNVIWIKTGGAIEVAHTWNGIEWVKITPTEAQEVGAETPQGAQQKADQAEQSAKQHADQKAQEAEQHAKSYAGTVAEQAKQQAVTEAEQKVNQAKTELEADIALKADATWVNGQLVLKANASDVYTKTEVDNALNSKVSVTQYNTDMSGVVTRLNSAESRITQTENEIATKVSNTQYQQDKTTLEGDILSLETRINQAETSITQLSNEITLKASQSEVDTLEGRVSTAESSISLLSNEINLKVNKDGVVNAINVSNEGIKISGTKLHITANTTIDNGVIKNAHIESLNASKIIATSLSAISANLGNVTAGTITGVQINGSRFFSQIPDSTGSYTEILDGKVTIYGKVNPNTAEGTKLSVERGQMLFETFSGTGLETMQLSITSSGFRGDDYIFNTFYRLYNFTGFEIGEGGTTKASIGFNGDASFRRFKGDWEAQTYNAYVLTGVEAGTGELRVTDKNGFQQTGIGYRDVRVRTTFANRVETNTDFGGFNLYLSAQSGSEVRATATGSTTTYVPVRASSFPTASSSKYKTNIEEFHEDAIAMLKDTRIYTYHLISNVEAGIYDKRKVGMIVEAAPALFRDEDAIDTYTVLSVLWRASQQQQQMIEELQKRVDDLELAWGVTE